VNPVRRISEALRAMRWTQLVLELALLILGILIALAVDGWMDDRRDARLERAYLERLERDLQQNLVILDGFIDFESRQTADGVLVYRGLRGAPGIEREAIAAGLNHLANRRTLRLMRATYQDLLSTGNLGLIRDESLRDAIVGVYEEAERTTTVVDRNNEALVDHAYGLPLVESGLVAPRFSTNLPGRLNGQLQSMEQQIGLPSDPESDRLWRLPADAPELTRLTNRVLRRTIVSTTTRIQAESLREQFHGAHEAVLAELARRPGR
jgi:hypothetical protein